MNSNTNIHFSVGLYVDSYFWVYVELCIPIINDVAMSNRVLIIWISSFIDNNIDVIAKSFTLSSGLKPGKDKSL